MSFQPRIEPRGRYW